MAQQSSAHCFLWWPIATVAYSGELGPVGHASYRSKSDSLYRIFAYFDCKL